MTSIIIVKFESFSKAELQSVLDHYNSTKPSHYNALEELDRCEGGFQIAHSSGSDNHQIKQMRWNRRKLDPFNYIGFNQEETLLLYNALVHVFTESFVSLV